MRKLRILVGLILFVLSCALLVWGFLPAARERHILPLPPSELTLPTPASFVPGPLGFDLTRGGVPEAAYI